MHKDLYSQRHPHPPSSRKKETFVYCNHLEHVAIRNHTNVLHIPFFCIIVCFFFAGYRATSELHWRWKSRAKTCLSKPEAADKDHPVTRIHFCWLVWPRYSFWSYEFSPEDVVGAAFNRHPFFNPLLTQKKSWSLLPCRYARCKWVNRVASRCTGKRDTTVLCSN